MRPILSFQWNDKIGQQNKERFLKICSLYKKGWWKTEKKKIAANFVDKFKKRKQLP